MQPDGSSGKTVGGENIPNVDSVEATIRATTTPMTASPTASKSAFVKELKTKTKEKAAKIKTQCQKVKAKKGKNPAVVFDVDDTLLWTYDLQDKGSGFAGDPALRDDLGGEEEVPVRAGDGEDGAQGQEGRLRRHRDHRAPGRASSARPART